MASSSVALTACSESDKSGNDSKCESFVLHPPLGFCAIGDQDADELAADGEPVLRCDDVNWDLGCIARHPND
jgi:hypothetical protein